MKNRVAAVALINTNNILLYLRDDKPSIPYPNHWCVIGGHVEPGESTLQGLEREVQEEIGFKLENPVYLGFFDDEVGNDCHMYTGKINKRIDEIYLTEGQRVGYFSYEESVKLLMPASLKTFLKENRERIFTQ